VNSASQSQIGFFGIWLCDALNPTLSDRLLENALSRAEGMRLAIACEPIIQTHPDVRVTVSIGVAMWTQTTSGITAMIQAADMALYHAKLSGRNRVRVTPVEYSE